jgi:DNA primase
MKPRLDRSRIDVVEMLEKLGVDVARVDGDEVVYRCPFPGHNYGDAHPSASMQLGTTIFFCFGCKQSGDAVTFVSLAEGVSPMQASRWLREAYDSNFREPQGSLWEELKGILEREAGRTPEPPQELPAGVLEPTLIDWRRAASHGAPEFLRAMLRRGLKLETLEEWEVGYDSRTARFTIPVRDREGRLVGFKGRRAFPEQHPKYLVLGGRGAGYPTYEVGAVVFGLHKVSPAIHKGPLVVTEGEFDAMAMWEAGFRVGAVGGSHFTERQLSLVRDVAREAVVFFDPDDAGQIGSGKVTSQLSRFVPVRAVVGAPGDPCSITIEERRSCVQNAESTLLRGLV